MPVPPDRKVFLARSTRAATSVVSGATERVQAAYRSCALFLSWFGNGRKVGPAPYPWIVVQSLILMCSPQGGGWHQRPTPEPQSAQITGK